VIDPDNPESFGSSWHGPATERLRTGDRTGGTVTVTIPTNMTKVIRND